VQSFLLPPSTPYVPGVNNTPDGNISDSSVLPSFLQNSKELLNLETAAGYFQLHITSSVPDDHEPAPLEPFHDLTQLLPQHSAMVSSFERTSRTVPGTSAMTVAGKGVCDERSIRKCARIALGCHQAVRLLMLILTRFLLPRFLRLLAWFAVVSTKLVTTMRSTLYNTLATPESTRSRANQAATPSSIASFSP